MALRWMVDARGVNQHLHLIWRHLLLVVPINGHMESGALCTSSKERRLGICKNSDYMTQATLAQVSILVQTITSEFLKWTGRCCPYPLNGSSVLLLLAGNCLPYHQPAFLATEDSKKAFGPSRFLSMLPVWGSCFNTSLGGPKTEHPCCFPASPDASDAASDVIHRSPSQVEQD